MIFGFGLLTAIAIGSMSPRTMEARPDLRSCQILLHGTGGAPYRPTAPGDLLATFNAAVLGQLITSDESFQLRPALLEDFFFDHKSGRYLLRLRDGLRFHHGRLATSADLEFSIVRGFFSEQRSFYQIYLKNVEGVGDVKLGEKFKSGRIPGVKIVDHRTVSVALAHPNPAFLHSLTNPFFGLVPQEALNEDYLTWKGAPIGAGPYRVKGSGYADGKVVLELTDETLRSSGAPQVVELHTSHRANSKYDLVYLPPSEVSLNGFSQWRAPKPAAVRTLFFSNRHPLGSDKNFRLGVQKLISRAQLVGDQTDVSVSYEILPKHFYGRLGIRDPFNLSEARELFAKVSQQRLKEVLRIPVFVNGAIIPTRIKRYADEIAAQFAAVGIRLEFYPSNEKFLSEQTAKSVPFHFAGRVADYVDPLIMFAAFQEGSPYFSDQPIGPEKDRLESLYKKAADARNLEERYETVRELSRFVMESAIAVALLEEHPVYYFDPKRVGDLGAQPTPLTLFIQNLRMNR